jgi:Tfp pilus assembly protein PilO
MTTRDAGGWVRGNLLPLTILGFQLVQFALSNNFEVKAHAKELSELRAKVTEVEGAYERKETLVLKLDALRAEVSQLREQLQKHDNDTRRQPR